MTDDVKFGDLLGKYRQRCGWSQEDLAKKAGVSRNAIVLWERHERGRQTNTHPQSRGVVLRLAEALELFTKEERNEFLNAAGFSMEHWPAEYWNVPYQRNPYFVGRETILQSLRQTLVPGTKITALTQSIGGLGGVGKTQVAIEYAHRYGEQYEAVLWISADSLEVATAAFLQLSTEVLGLPEQQKAEEQIAEVKRWLQKRHGWLLIFDNVEDPQAVLSTFIPSKHQGSVLITTRRRDMGTIMLPLFSEEDAILFLLRRAERIARKASVTEATADDFSFARDLCQLLDRLPLALDQAGAYIAANGCSLQHYTDLYHKFRPRLLDRRNADDQPGRRSEGDHPDSVLMTFWLSWEQVQEHNSLAGKVLQYCAFLAPNQIPEQFVMSGIMMSDIENAPEELEMDEALGLLYRYSLIERAEHILSLHRLVQEVMQKILSEEEQYYWMKIAITVVNNAFPNGNHETWSLCEFLLPHALVCSVWTSVLRQKKSSAVGAWLLSAIGRYLCGRARYEDAEPLLLQALSIIEEQFGAFHPETAVCLNNLASLYEKQGRYEDAESLYKQALAITEEQLGPFRLETAAILNNLASLYENQGYYGEAEPLYKRALSIREERLGPFRPETAGSLNNLASLYEKQGRYKEAEPLYKRALAITEEQLGSSHPHTAATLNNLAELYRALRRYGEAEPLYKRALAITEEQLGPSHPHTAATLNNLAELYRALRRYGEAEPLYKRALAITEEQLGPSHPETTATLNNLALLYENQGCYGEAESLYKQALSILEEQLGSSHPDTTNTLGNLAEFYRLQRRYGEAEPLYKKAVMLSRVFLGVEHPHSQHLMRGYLMLLLDRYPDGFRDALSQLLEQTEQN